MKSVLIYTVNKAASMFIHRFSLALSHELELGYYSTNLNHKEEIKQNGWRSLINNYPENSLFAPIRAQAHMDIYPDDLDSYQIFLHLRDPRDVLTSKYFSRAFNHPVAKDGFNKTPAERKAVAEAGIDEFALEFLGKIKEDYDSYIEKLYSRGNVTFVKYETMVQEYDKWLEDILRPLEDYTGNTTELYNKLYEQFKGDFEVEGEDIFRHKRKITPGDYKEKLGTETIDILNTELSDILATFGYSR